MTTDLHLVSKPAFRFSDTPIEYASQPVPSLLEYEQLWAAWDFVTGHMIPKEKLLSKPIKLRNCCLFYLGHIPTFLDIHLTRASGDRPTSPHYFYQIFERGIDPDVDNPEHCHAHSEVPDEWPPLEEILSFQERVRARVRSLYQSQNAETSRKVGRAMWITFEHEGKVTKPLNPLLGYVFADVRIAMHLETLLYMLLQSDYTRSPGIRPDFELLAREAQSNAVPNEWIRVPTTSFDEGMDDPENDEGPDRYFGWDNEKPRRSVSVPAFEAKARPLTNEDYARFLDQTGSSELPASWILDRSKSSDVLQESHDRPHGDYINGASPALTGAYLKDKSVRTVYGSVALEHALHWPVFASYDELCRCAAWMNGRIPTKEEVRSIYNYVDRNKNKHTNSITTKKISAVNG